MRRLAAAMGTGTELTCPRAGDESHHELPYPPELPRRSTFRVLPTDRTRRSARDLARVKDAAIGQLGLVRPSGESVSEVQNDEHPSARVTASTADAARAKAPTGIAGFDEITYGGLPRGRTTLLVGGPGSGKTIFALQSLLTGARRWSEPGIFVAFEETAAQIIGNAQTLSWNLSEVPQDRLFFLDANVSPETVQAGDFDVSGLIAALRAKAETMGARRIVLDGVDVLLTLLRDPAAQRRELHRLHTWLLESGLTAVVTAKADAPGANDSFYGPMQFMVDCVVALQQGMTERVSLRELRVLKYRGSAFVENAVPFCITSEGVDVAEPGLRDPSHEAGTERVSTGVERLDTMLSGGYYRGSSILISGHPGTAKSTLAGAFVAAACKRGERALLVSFDEGEPEFLRNLESVSISLAPHIRAGLLRVVSFRNESRSAEEHLLVLKRLIRSHEPRSIVIDPLSALVHAGGFERALGVAQRLLRLTKEGGITLLCTTLLGTDEVATEGTALQISTIADTWIQLSYNVYGGERNRALTVIKARGTKHSNQVRELVLSNEGVSLADVYTAGGEVLMGTARWEKETAAREAAARLRAEQLSRRGELLAAQADMKAQIEALARQLETATAEVTALDEAIAAHGRVEDERRRALASRRRGDSDTTPPSGTEAESTHREVES